MISVCCKEDCGGRKWGRSFRKDDEDEGTVYTESLARVSATRKTLNQSKEAM
jgi:hypothetical protein